MPISMKVLKRIALVGGVAAIGSAAFISWRIPENFKKEPYYVKAIELLHGYPPAVEMLGEPIKTRKVDLGNTNTTYSDGLNARLAIPLVGRKQRGTLHCWASRYNTDERWTVDKLDLQVQDTRWTFYVDPSSTNKTTPKPKLDDDADNSGSVSSRSSAYQEANEREAAKDRLKYLLAK